SSTKSMRNDRRNSRGRPRTDALSSAAFLTSGDSLSGMGPPIEFPEELVLDVGGPLHVSVWEGDPARTFLCLPGLGGSAASWLSVGGGLSAHGRVIAVELPGTGRTRREGRGSTLED